jgi:carboxylesterase type B
MALSADDLYAANPGGTGPVVDGVALTVAPADAVAAGDWSKTPVMIGSNRDEDAFFDILEQVPTDLTELGFDALAKAHSDFTKEELATVKHIYGPGTNSSYPFPADKGPYSDWWWAYDRSGTDAVPGLGPCGVRWFSHLMLEGGAQDGVFCYHFAHPTQVDYSQGGIPGMGPGSVVVPHASEIAYVFGDGGGTDRLLTPPNEGVLAAIMSTFWSNFARTGDPNKGAAVPVAWPAYVKDADELIRFDVAPPSGGGTRVQSGLRKEACDFMENRHKLGRAIPWRRAG